MMFRCLFLCEGFGGVLDYFGRCDGFWMPICACLPLTVVVLDLSGPRALFSSSLGPTSCLSDIGGAWLLLLSVRLTAGGELIGTGVVCCTGSFLIDALVIRSVGCGGKVRLPLFFGLWSITSLLGLKVRDHTRIAVFALCIVASSYGCRIKMLFTSVCWTGFVSVSVLANCAEDFRTLVASMVRTPVAEGCFVDYPAFWTDSSLDPRKFCNCVSGLPG